MKEKSAILKKKFLNDHGNCQRIMEGYLLKPIINKDIFGILKFFLFSSEDWLSMQKLKCKA